MTAAHCLKEYFILTKIKKVFFLFNKIKTLSENNSSIRSFSENIEREVDTIRIGSTDRTTGGIILTVENFFLHPNYNKTETDLALIKINGRIVNTENGNYYTINSICLPEEYIKNYDNEKANISGWGYIDNRGQLTNDLMSAELEINNYEMDYLLKRGIRAFSDAYKTCKVCHQRLIKYFLS
jgi:hypothetical protein